MLIHAAFGQAPPAPDALLNGKQYLIDSIKLDGSSRLPERSYLALSGLKIGSTVSEKEVRAACDRINKSGLVTNVEYAYEAYPDKPGVALVLTPHDELPLLPARIEIPKIAEDDVWKYLQGVDPLFTRALPRTDAAMRLYSRYIQKYTTSLGRNDVIIEEVLADKSGQPTTIVFKPGKLMGAPKIKR